MNINSYRHHHHSAFEIERIKKRASEGSYDQYFVFMGGSAAGLESLTSDEEVASLLSKKTNLKIGFSSIVASHHSFSDEIKVINALKDYDVTFILGVEALRFWHGKANELQQYVRAKKYTRRKYYYLPLPDRMADYLKSQGVKVPLSQKIISIGGWNVLGEAIKKKTLVYIDTGTIVEPYDRHAVSDEKTPLTKSKIRRAKKYYKSKLYKKYKKNSRYHYDAFNELISFVDENNIKLIIYDHPQPDVFIPNLDRMAPGYLDRVNAISQDVALGFLTFQNDIPWETRYFHDAHHMVASGRAVLTAVFTDKLANFINAQMH